ncbi:GNAT family N-acetyltransferase [Halotia branconii]|uniref:GNAT family N-acetyltransferase n=1 Tax=Halotia branconii CENA392 TaxID=1539056 RepID=A0AAJ6P7E6_9CYAN|nr:GNAT family N-acetyltransferase [Halotia branconii]WGV23491.1 GNAT family N-acetyltransferase [Halotia branconii CENA392]
MEKRRHSSGVEVLSASINDKPIIQRMMELYQHDFSEFEDKDINEHGYFGYPYLDYYWVEDDRYPFIVRIGGKLTGFVLVNQYTYIPDSQYSIAEFFILRKYRQQGIGKQVAFQIFDRFCGKWEIHQITTNIVAQKFWRSVIGEYTTEKFTEILINDDCQKTIQCFDNTEIV